MEAEFLACKLEDVRAVDYSARYRSKIEAGLKRYSTGKHTSMGDAAWDRAVVEALGGTVKEEVERLAPRGLYHCKNGCCEWPL